MLWQHERLVYNVCAVHCELCSAKGVFNALGGGGGGISVVLDPCNAVMRAPNVLHNPQRTAHTLYRVFILKTYTIESSSKPDDNL